MNGLRYFSQVVERSKSTPSRLTVARMEVRDYNHDHLVIDIEDGTPVVLDAVQVDKLRQQFHGWLHERALGSNGKRWEEIQ